jgi:hypothetical protein
MIATVQKDSYSVIGCGICLCGPDYGFGGLVQDDKGLV